MEKEAPDLQLITPQVQLALILVLMGVVKIMVAVALVLKTILVAVLAIGAPNIAIKAHFLLFAFPELHGRTIRL